MGNLAIAIMLLAYSLQIWKINKGISKPHLITWFGFGLLTGIGYLVQRQEGAGAGSWVMGLTALFCFLIAGMTQYKNHWRISDFDFWDWASFVLGIILFALYLTCKHLSWGPITSAILATLADLVLYGPTLKEAWSKPENEYWPAYALNSLKFLPSLFAMDNYSTATCLYPAALVFMNGFMVFYFWWRKNSLAYAKVSF